GRGLPEAGPEPFEHGAVVGVGAVLAELIDSVPALEALGPGVGVRVEHERRSHHAGGIPVEGLEGPGEVERAVPVAQVDDGLGAQAPHGVEVVLEMARVGSQRHLLHDLDSLVAGRRAEEVGVVRPRGPALPEEADLGVALLGAPAGAHPALDGYVAVGHGEAVLAGEPDRTGPADARHTG